MEESIKKIIGESIEAKRIFAEKESKGIAAAAKMIIDRIAAGGKVLIFGNGGSAADSQHMAAELVGRFKRERRSLAAIALTTDTSTLTAIANDYGYENVFSRQVEALGGKHDVAVGISTSGKSANVVTALKTARSMGLGTIGLSGNDGGDMRRECDILICAPGKDTPRVQECHITAIHIICELVESAQDRK